MTACGGTAAPAAADTGVAGAASSAKARFIAFTIDDSSE